jgi:hypothetical protein
MNSIVPSKPVTAQYYIDGVPRVSAIGSVEEARFLLRRIYDDPELAAITLEIRYAAYDLDGLSWKDAFDRVLSDREDHLSW